MSALVLRLGLLASLGTVLGSLFRYGISVLVPTDHHGAFPYATLLVNLTGAIAIGFVARNSKIMNADRQRTFFVTGVLGGFTTFSAFAVETVNLAVGTQAETVHQGMLAVIYVVITFVVGVSATTLALGREQ